MEEKTFCIYKHTNKVNGKVYVGITSQKPERRWGHSGNGYSNQVLFYRAIKKYGWDNFNHEILYDNLSKEDACGKEIYLIKYYNSSDPEKGYNISTGGSGGSTGYKWTEERKKEVSERMSGKNHPFYGKKMPKESVEKMRKHRKGKCCGKNHPFYGKHLSCEIRKKISESKKGVPNLKLKGIKFSEEHKKHISESHQGPKPWLKGRTYKKNPEWVHNTAVGHYKAVRCIETNEVFESIKLASKSKKVNSSSISAVCLGKRKTAGGYHWEYINKEGKNNG